MQQLFALLLYFEHAEHFYISHFAYNLRYNTIIDHSWKLLTMTLNYVMFMLNSNEPNKAIHLQNFANQSMLNGALVIEMKARKTLVV